MPVEIKAIIYNGWHDRNLQPGITQYHPPGYLLASGLTVSDTYYTKIFYGTGGTGATIGTLVTVGRFVPSTPTALAPFASQGGHLGTNTPAARAIYYDTGVTGTPVSVSLFAIHTASNVTVATAFMRPTVINGYVHPNHGTWSVTQGSDRSVGVRLTDLQSVASWSVLFSIEQDAVNGSAAGGRLPVSKALYRVDLLDNDGTQLATEDVHWPKDGSFPAVTFSAALVTSNGNYITRVSNMIGQNNDAYAITLMSQEIQSVLTAPAVTSGGGGGSNMFSWLNNDYWYLTDLQVNLGTRAVTHRHGTLELRPNDTVNFAVLFHDGSAGKDPVATDLRLAVRSSTNASAYYFWANPSVTTTSVSGDIYYTITVTASDEDLLSAQAAGLLAGSNNSQTLLAEVQWTTTRGTFTSDTFNITVANEVAREPDV